MVTTIWSPTTRLHDPKAEVWVGVHTPGTEVAERVDRIVDAATERGWPVVKAMAHADPTALATVHDEEFLAHMSAIYDEWMRSGIPELVGQDRVVPYMFATEHMLGGLPAHLPPATHARAGWYCYDTMTLIGPGTWEAARAAVDCALTAVDLVVGGERAAYAVCRPPGHHVTRNGYGGSCYLNNAAVTAQALRDQGHERVAVVDVDAHHGNGTAAIFYERADVFYGSVHIDPGAGWFPHVVGYADETGRAMGAGATLNLPLPEETGDGPWLEAVETLAAAATSFGASALVVSLGVDAAADDPESPLRVTETGYGDAGRVLAGLGLPTVAVQEGGYHLDSIGGLVTSFLDAFTDRPGGGAGHPRPTPLGIGGTLGIVRAKNPKFAPIAGREGGASKKPRRLE
jgi:acetoin utilization deacetylase AcuC-like enzyme